MEDPLNTQSPPIPSNSRNWSDVEALTSIGLTIKEMNLLEVLAFVLLGEKDEIRET